MEFIPCIFQCIKLSIDEICDIKIKMKNQDVTVLNDLNSLVSNIKKYRKKDRKIILKLISLFLEQNISLNNSSNDLLDDEKKQLP